MRTVATFVTAALTLAACTTSSTAVEPTPPSRHVAISRLPEQPAHDTDQPLDQPPAPVDRSDPAAVAVALIVDGLTEQGLQIVDLGVERFPASGDAATIRVAATHQAGAAATSHTSVYELDLTRDPNGSWRPIGFQQAQ